MTDNTWILIFRTDFLTYIFKYFPLLASDYFYIMSIALGYWLRPSRLIFASLGFLVPFSTLLNCLLKNIFRISRPDLSLHLIPVHDPFGFPSGDVQVASLFWMYIFTEISHKKFRYLCFLPIIGIAISRVYLGVHSLYDVIGGMVVGFCVLCLWKKYLEKTILLCISSLKIKQYCFLLFLTILFYILISYDMKWPYMVPIAIGSLVGFFASLWWIGSQEFNQEFKSGTSGLTAVLFLVTTLLIAVLLPIIKTNELIIFLSLIAKYAIVVFCIFYLLPKISLIFKSSMNR